MNTYQRWKQGMKEITPVQQIKARVTGYLWGSIGLAIALFFLLIRDAWGFSVFLAAMIWLQWWQYRGAKQEYIGAKKIQDELDEIEIRKII